MQLKKKICKQCGNPRYIWGKRLCKLCYPHKKYTYKRKPTGERELFLEIWAERKHECVNCKSDLGKEPKTFFFSHIKSKGAHPELRLNKDNIQLLCQACHVYYDHGTKEQYESRSR